MTRLSPVSHQQQRATMNWCVVRSLNRAMVRKHGPIPRTSIARVSNLNKSTVTSIVNGILEESLLMENLVRNTVVGGKPLSLSLKTGKHLIGT